MMKKFLFFLTAFAAYGLIGASHTASPDQHPVLPVSQPAPVEATPAVITPPPPQSIPAAQVASTAQAGATTGISKELTGKSGRLKRALSAVERNAMETVAVGTLAGCTVGGLGCVYGAMGALAFIGSIEGAHALYGAVKYLYCETSCTREKGADRGAVFSSLLTAWIQRGRAEGKTDHDTLTALMKFIMTDKSPDATAVRKAVKCLKGCGTFATKNFTFAFLSTLEDVNNYGISILASLLLDTVIKWSVRMPNGNPRDSKLVRFTRYDTSACNYLTGDEVRKTRCEKNFDYLKGVADEAVDPKKVAAAIQVAKVK